METKKEVSTAVQESAAAIKIKVGLLYGYPEDGLQEHESYLDGGWEFEIPPHKKEDWKRIYARGDKRYIYSWLQHCSEFKEQLVGIFYRFKNIHILSVHIASVENISYRHWHKYSDPTSEDIKKIATDFNCPEEDAMNYIDQSELEVELFRLRYMHNERSTSFNQTIEQECICGGKIVKDVYVSANFRLYEPIHTSAPVIDSKPFKIRQFIPVRCGTCGAENEIDLLVELS